MFFRDAAPANFKEAKASDTHAFARFHRNMRKAHVLIPPSQFEAWFLSEAHDDAAVDATLVAAAR
jgi:glutamate-1-semialdehyde 2,1-aminomutase